MTPTIPSDYRAVLALGAVGLLAYFIIRRDVVAGVRAVGTAINPLDERNLANRAVTAVGETLSGSKSGTWSLGSAIYDLFNEDANLVSDRRARQLLANRAPIQPQDKPTALLRW